jgi:hypothetical protein
METAVIIGLVGIAVTIVLGWFVHWRTSKMMVAIFMLITALPGGDVATRIYEDMRKSRQVRGVPFQTKDGKWAVSYKIPPYKENLPKP